MGWDDKATSCRQVADQLGVTLDSLVYVDVSPSESAWVGTSLIKVETVPLSRDAGEHARTLRGLASLESDNLFASRPPPLAAVPAPVEQGSAWVAGVEDYLSQLRTRVTLGQADRVALPSLVEIVERAEAVQLVGEPVTRDCARIWMGSGIHQGYWVRVEDRFGDQGLVGLVVVEIGEESWGIESFQLSSNLLERGVDAEVLRSVAEIAVAQGAQRLELLGKGRNRAAFESLGFISSARKGVRGQLDLSGDWRSSTWRPSYVEDTVVLADEETEVAA